MSNYLSIYKMCSKFTCQTNKNKKDCILQQLVKKKLRNLSNKKKNPTIPTVKMHGSIVL